MEKKTDKTLRTFRLLFVFGLLILFVGIIWGSIQNAKELYLILTTVGGTICGLSLSWLIEENYKRADGREDASELFKRAVSIYENTLNVNSGRPNETEIAFFRKKPFHFYYSTKNEDGKLFWNYIIIRFDSDDNQILGRLCTEVDISNFSKKQTLTYLVELERRLLNDCLIIHFRHKNTKDANLIAILDSWAPEVIKSVSGFIYHDDWTENWRISPSLLSSSPLIDRVSPGALPHTHALKLQSLWEQKFYKDNRITVFEPYK